MLYFETQVLKLIINYSLPVCDLASTVAYFLRLALIMIVIVGVSTVSVRQTPQPCQFSHEFGGFETMTKR